MALLSGLKRLLPNIIDSRQVSPGNLGLNLPQVKQPWHFQERRYLIITRHGPMELVLRPRQVLICFCLVITGLASSGWLALQWLTSAVQVTHSEMAKPALAATVLPGDLPPLAVGEAGPAPALAGILESLPEPSDTPLARYEEDSINLADNRPPPPAMDRMAKDFTAPAPGTAFVSGPIPPLTAGARPEPLPETMPETMPEPLPETMQASMAEAKKAPLPEAGSALPAAPGPGLQEGPPASLDLALAAPGTRNLQPPGPDWQADMGAPQVDNRVRAMRFYLSIEKEARQMAALLDELGINAQPELPALSRPDPDLLQAGLDSPDFLIGLRDRFLLLEAYRDIFRKIPFQPPMAHYYVSSKYGKRKHPTTKKWSLHHGLDMAGAWQETVIAPADGEVIFAGWEGSFGRVVRLRHAHGIITTYAHLGGIKVATGQTVSEGTIIGRMGSSGRTDGAHLHYEIRVNGISRDPETFFAIGRKLMSRGSLRPGASIG